MAAERRSRLMSGMRPTHRLHIGNYYGALKNWVRLQEDHDCFFMAADWHAMTDHYKEPGQVNANIREIISDWIAWGINPEKSLVYVQSQVPEIAEIHMILSNITPMGWLERVTTWKDAQEELEAKDARNLGRFAYPVLQTADILAFEANVVPVGKDQIPHLELSREIVRRFNHLYKGNLPEPKHLLSETPYVVGTDGRKMSKSYGNFVPLTPDEKELKKIVNAMVTDPARVTLEDPGNPQKCNLFQHFHTLFSSEEDREWATQGCTTAGIGCGHCKVKLRENMEKLIAGPREKKKELLNNSGQLDEIIAEGNKRARQLARETLEKMKGFML